MEHVGHSSDRKPGLEVQFFAPPPDLKACFGNFYRLEVSLPRGQTVTALVTDGGAASADARRRHLS